MIKKCLNCEIEFKGDKNSKCCTYQCWLDLLKKNPEYHPQYKGMKSNCLFCNKEIKQFPCRPRKYCDSKCRFNHIRKSPEYHPNFDNKKGKNINCLSCKKVFYIRKSEMLNGKKYCSRECYFNHVKLNPELAANYKTGITHKKCEICGERRNQNQRFCSSTCYAKEKSVVRRGEGNPFYGKNHSVEFKKMLSNKRKGINMNDDIKRKISLKMKGSNNPFFGKKHSVKTIKKIMTKNLIFSNILYKEVGMRSSWEVKFAEWLDSQNLTWTYEPDLFKLYDFNVYYIPDFFVLEWCCYVEVKGYMNEKSIKKISAFKNQFGENSLLVIDEEEMIKRGIL